MARIGHQDSFVQDPIVPATRTYAYRNKLEFSFGPTDEGPALGFHRAGRWDEIMPVTACLLMSEAGNEARRVVEAWARRTGAAAWNGGRTRATCATSCAAPPTAPASSADARHPLRQAPEGVLARRRAGGARAGLRRAAACHHRRRRGGDARPRDGYRHRPRLVRGAPARPPPPRLVRRLPADQHRDVRAPLRARDRGGRPGRRRDRLGPVLGNRVDRARDRRLGRARVRRRGGRGGRRARRRERRAQRHRQREFVQGDVAKAVRPLFEGGLPRPDVVVLDPPRAGLTPKAVRACSSWSRSASSTSPATRPRWPEMRSC